MKKQFASFVGGLVVASGLFLFCGAVTPPDYGTACQAIGAEIHLQNYLNSVEDVPPEHPRMQASKKRLKHWVSVMEQFKP